MLQILVNDSIKNLPSKITDKQADLNYISIKKAADQIFSAKALIYWEDELKNLTKKFRPEVFERNVQILEDYIKLCLENGARPVAVVWPFAPVMRENYDQNLLVNFRNTLRLFEKAYDFKFVDLFDLPLGYDCFYNMAHLNIRGAYLSSSVLNIKLRSSNTPPSQSANVSSNVDSILPIEDLCKLSYDKFFLFSQFSNKDEYNNLLDRVFKISVQKLRKKDKIKVGFVLYDSSMWCGDELYIQFENNERYEPTVFLCLRTDQSDKETVVKDFWHGVEQFKSKNINIVAVPEYNFEVPKQDILIFLTPYFEVLPNAFKPSSINIETLISYIPYGLNITTWDTSNEIIEITAWKLFFETKERFENDDKNCKVGMLRGHYSGHPKMDKFFKSWQLEYEWKTSQPNAVKIIYAPHFTIDFGIRLSTFQHNYQFMYEYAKAHPETSWVFKPHPNLLFSAVSRGVFPNQAAFEEYLQKWNDLPNAKVETGAYYQSIFATSDGMILDSASFISEYQYTGKPLLFLTNEYQRFNELGQQLMKVLYRVDGRDFNGISNFIENVLINGNDEMFETRRRFFDEHFNYKKINGILASEFIFKAIDQEIKLI